MRRVWEGKGRIDSKWALPHHTAVGCGAALGPARPPAKLPAQVIQQGRVQRTHLWVLQAECQQVCAHAAEQEEDGQVVEPTPAAAAGGQARGAAAGHQQQPRVSKEAGRQHACHEHTAVLLPQTAGQPLSRDAFGQPGHSSSPAPACLQVRAPASPEVHPAHHLQRAAVLVALVDLVLHKKTGQERWSRRRGGQAAERGCSAAQRHGQHIGVAQVSCGGLPSKQLLMLSLVRQAGRQHLPSGQPGPARPSTPHSMAAPPAPRLCSHPAQG